MNAPTKQIQARSAHPYGHEALISALDEIRFCALKIPDICRITGTTYLYQEGWMMPVKCCLACKSKMAEWAQEDNSYFEIQAALGAKATWEQLYAVSKIRLHYPRNREPGVWVGLGDK